MKAQIITIGDEILIGQVVNSNAAFIGEKLTRANITVVSTSVVGDYESALKEEFERAFKLADIVLVTGGLGPTHDDVTRKCVVDFFQTELVLDDDVLNDIKKFFEQRGRELTPTNKDQAMVPAIAKSIRNQRGTAPGIFIDKDNKIFIAMPGVPYEMKEMMESFVIPELQKRIGVPEEIFVTKNLLTTGIPESMLSDKLGDINILLNGAKMAFLPNQFGVRLRITTSGKTIEAAQNHYDEIEQQIRLKVGRYIYGKESENLEEVIARLMIDRGLKLAIAESCTGGLIGHRITNVSGSSRFLERGVIAYSNAAKVEILNVNEDTIAKNGAVSLEVAMQMAEGVRQISGADIGLAVTGVMGPTGGTETKPVGLVNIGLSDETKTYAREFRFGDDRLLNKDRTSQAALDLVRRHLLNISYED